MRAAFQRAIRNMRSSETWQRALVSGAAQIEPPLYARPVGASVEACCGVRCAGPQGGLRHHLLGQPE